MSFVVLGFAGESGSGKDLCSQWVVDQQGFVRIAFADAFKRFVQTVFEFGVESLWGEPEYRHIPMAPCSNQTSVASGLLHHCWDKARENLILNVHDWVNELALSMEEKAQYVHCVGVWFDECQLRSNTGLITPRLALQLLGTEHGRAFKDTIWTDYVFEEAIPRIRDGECYKRDVGFLPNTFHESVPGVVINDHRIWTELNETQRRGGYVVKLNRLSNRGRKNEAEEAGIKGHVSESEQRSIPDDAYDLVLELEEGKKSVHSRLGRMFQEEEWQRKREESNDRSPAPSE